MLNSLDDVLQRLGALPEPAKASIAQLAEEKTKGMLWIPNPGPQTQAWFSEADEIFYGGQAGGGKTDLELGLALGPHKKVLLLRRTNKEANGLVERMEGIIGNRDGWNSQQGMWRFDNGKTVEIGGCQLEEDKQKYKGNPHDLICVGLGTPVLMADGSYTAVERVQVGDSVMTLEGPRRVLKAFPVGKRESVRVTLNSVSQVQSTTHKVLTNEGWVSLDTPNVLPPYLRLYPTPKVSNGPHIASSKPSSKHESASLVQRSSLLWGRSTALLQQAARGIWYRLGQRGLNVGTERVVRETDYAVFGGVPQALWLSRIYSWYVRAIGIQKQPIATRTCERSSLWRGAYDALKKSILPNWTGRYSYGSHPYGGRTHALQGLLTAPTGDLSSLHPRDDVGLRSPNDSLVGDAGTAHTRTHHRRLYVHPYTMGVRQSIQETTDSAYSVTPVGKVELYDLEVEEVNHFITKGGIINKNCFDEVSDFTKSQYTFIITWNRSADKNQRCRIVAAGNPPTQPEGLWVIERWAAWLDPTHPNPAQAGELRWYTAGPDGHEIEVEGKGPHIINGEEVFARSRTFIPAKLSDNPDLAATDYAATLAALPEEYRAAYRDGNFQAGLRDDAFQTIPTSWVKAAQMRWKSTPPVNVPMCAMGVDVAQGGNDQTIIAIRHDGWYAPLIRYPGKDTPDGKVVAGKVIQHRRDNCPVAIDVGGGWGGDAHGHLKANNVDSYAYMGVKDSLKRSEDKQYKFFNVRAEAYWRFREALDPSQPQGSTIMLPDDPELVADLCSPKFKIGPNGIQIEPKDKLKDRLGRSPDKGDAVVMAWWVGPKGQNIQGGWSARKTTPKVNLGRVGNRRK